MLAGPWGWVLGRDVEPAVRPRARICSFREELVLPRVWGWQGFGAWGKPFTGCGDEL